ncbi:MAG TPA: type II toxin-antitoxin system VapC family toxin [Acetobacteraceae bacterium]|nr:type II toxin-antitoxin system VapC family toxin [Acetobacteraceae bacterium]
MFIDASALVAIIASDDDADSLAARLGQARDVQTSAVAVWEAVLGLARRLNITLDNASGLVDRLLSDANATVVPIDRATGREALITHARYGKGCHPAALNMGDCFAYACTRQLATSLLCKGNNFPQTDIELA